LGHTSTICQLANGQEFAVHGLYFTVRSINSDEIVPSRILLVNRVQLRTDDSFVKPV